MGWQVHPQVGCSGYRVDLGIVDPKAPGRYLAGVECDGAMYHSAATARDRDRLRQMVLERLGWKLLRIWSTDWWVDWRQQLQVIHQRLLELVEQATQPEEVTPAGDAEPPSQEAGLEFEPICRGPSADPAAPEVTAVPEQDRTYRPCELASRAGRGFYDLSANAILVSDLRTVAEAEGPVLEKVLFDRVARAWGLARTGSRITERLGDLASRALLVEREDDGQRFYWPQSAQIADWSDFRIAAEQPESRRSVLEVSQRELSNLVLHVLQSVGAASRDEIARSVSRLVGTDRTSSQILARVDLVTTNLVATKRCRAIEVQGQERIAPGV